jgi:hypothetical protein
MADLHRGRAATVSRSQQKRKVQNKTLLKRERGNIWMRLVRENFWAAVALSFVFVN